MKILCLLILAASCAISLGYHSQQRTSCGACENHHARKHDMSVNKCGCCPKPCCCKCVQIPTDPGECHMVLDLMWIVDSSNSIGSDWIFVQNFVKAVTGSLSDLGSDQLAALVCYGNRSPMPLKHWCFGGTETNNIGNFNSAVMGLDLKKGNTNTADGIDQALLCLGSGEDRVEAPNVCILMTDGKSNDRTEDLPALAVDLDIKCNGNVLVIGVTDDVDATELLVIANNKIERVITVPSFPELIGMLDDVIKEICPEPQFEEECFCCCPPPPMIETHSHPYSPYGYQHQPYSYPHCPYPYPLPPYPYPSPPQPY